MLHTIIAEKWLSANAVFGLFPANAVGDDIEIYADEARREKLMSWHNLRQQQERRRASPTTA
jgi:5-methyltetrahydrofolate--homocysteine methyltransferase